MSYSIKHEGPRQFNVYFEIEPGEFELVERFKSNVSAKKFIDGKNEEKDRKKLLNNVPKDIQFLGDRTVRAWTKAQKSNSRKNAIRAMCLICVGGVSKEVSLCTAKDCPLWKYRLTG